MTTVSGFQSDSTNDIFVASGSADSTVKLWRIPSQADKNVSLQANCFHTIDFKNGFAITLELVPVEIVPSVSLLFVATDKNKVHVYQVTNETVGEFRFASFRKTSVVQIDLVFVLSGHEDWIRTIAIEKNSETLNE